MSATGYIIRFKTTLSDAFFLEDEDNDRFDEWFGEQLVKKGLFNWELEDTPEGILDGTKLSLYVDEFTYKHELEVFVKVDDGSHTYEELDDNEFYSMLMYSHSSGYFVSPYIENATFEVYRDFEVFV